MIHNGIEYGLMQAYAEGFEILEQAAQLKLPDGHRFEFKIADISELWRRGSVISSWLLDLAAIALAEDPNLSSQTGFVEDSGEGRWAIMAAIEEGVSADTTAASLFRRFRSRKEHTFAEKVLSALRTRFGGHLEPPGGA
jgi:6-phosphogluconate dehydrogenase